MKLAELISLGAALLEEYDAQRSLHTDADFIRRFKLLYTLGQMEVCHYAPILRKMTVEVKSGDAEQAFLLESDVKTVVCVRARQKNDLAPVRYEVLDGTLYLRAPAGKWDVYYHAYPAVIDETTPDTFEPDLCRQGQVAVCYWVVSSMMASDPSVNYAALERRYQQAIDKLVSQAENAPLTLDVLGGRG